jgi:hypothetical protein
MAKLLERLRQHSDDVLRLVGMWTLVGSAVTTFVLAVAAGIWAYVRGAPTTWLIFFGGIATGMVMVLLITTIAWFIRRIKRRATLRAELSGQAPKGFLDHMIDSFDAMASLSRLLNRMTAIAVESNKTMVTGTHQMNLVRPLGALNDARVKRWIGKRVAKKLNRDSERLAAVVTDYERTAEKLQTSQMAFIQHALKQALTPAVRETFRASLIQFREAQRVGTQTQRSFVAVLTSSGFPTGDMILAGQRRADVISRSLAVTEKLEQHATRLLALIDQGPGPEDVQTNV